MADKDDIKRWRQEIKHANAAKALDEARNEYIRLMEQVDWRVANRALADALPILRTLGVAYPTECALVDKVLDLLKADHPLKAIGTGANGIAHVNIQGLYIKLKVEDDIVYVLSFHQWLVGSCNEEWKIPQKTPMPSVWPGLAEGEDRDGSL